MAGQPMHDQCPDTRVKEIVDTIAASAQRGTRELDAALGKYPGDARLHFLKGSLLASEQDYQGARAAMRRAVDLAPGYAIARFQLGFLLLTSGEPYPAEEAWGPLQMLPENHYLRHFVTGLTALIRDDFAETIRALKAGIARNQENPAMNRDMELIIEAVRNKPSGGDHTSSSVDLLLQQAAFKASRH